MNNHAKSISPLTPDHIEAWPANAIPEKWVEALFNKMAFTYGVKFADQWRGIDAAGIKRHWAEKLGVMTGQELTRGVMRLESRDWPPTLPEFIKLCRPVLDPVVAFHEALEQGGKRERGEPDEWSSPAIYWAWRRLGPYEFAHQVYAILRPRWEAALMAEMEKDPMVPVPAQTVALPAPGKARLSNEKAAQLLGEFKVKTLSDAGSGDSRRWATRIMARKEKGEHFSIFVVESAERQLGMR